MISLDVLTCQGSNLDFDALGYSNLSAATVFRAFKFPEPATQRADRPGLSRLLDIVTDSDSGPVTRTGVPRHGATSLASSERNLSHGILTLHAEAIVEDVPGTASLRAGSSADVESASLAGSLVKLAKL